MQQLRGAAAIAPAAPALAAAELVPVLPGWAPPPVPVHAVFASARYLTPKVRAFIDLAVQAMAGATPAWTLQPAAAHAGQVPAWHKQT